MPIQSYTKNYTGPANPTVYDPAWQSYTNLNAEQKATFQSFPQDLIKYAKHKRWQKEISPLTFNGITIDMADNNQRKIAGLKQAFDNGTLKDAVPFVTKDSVHTLDSAGVTALYAACVARVQDSYTALAALLADIEAKQVNNRAQIDAVLATL